jgi:hypothetical protein
MILALEEDSVLRVYESPAAAVQEVEALDAEETFQAIFDEQGQPYAIDWLRRNRRGLTCENGSYRLLPCGDPNEAALLSAIRSAVAIDPPSAEPTVRAIEQRLAT